MRRRAHRHQSGFALLEVLISMTILLFALGAVLVALESNQGTYVRSDRKIDVQQNARLALGELARHLRMAGYFPENFAAPAADPPLADTIRIATDDALAIYGDLDNSGTSNIFLFCLDGDLLRRGKAAAGDTAAYWCPAGEILAENVTALRFAYLDEDNASLPDPVTTSYALDGQTPGSAPSMADLSQRSAVRRVVVTITVTQPVPGQEAQVFTLGSEVRLRNVG